MAADRIDVPRNDNEEPAHAPPAGPAAHDMIAGVAKLDQRLLTILDPFRILPAIEAEFSR